MVSASITPALTASLTTPADAQPKNTEEAARQFEALLIDQMLRSARETASDEEDSTAETTFDIAGQQFAQLIADRGGLGLAKLLAHGLLRATEAKNRPDDPG